MPENRSQINDDELNQMIASLQGQPANGEQPAPVQLVTEQPVQPAVSSAMPEPMPTIDQSNIQPSAQSNIQPMANFNKPVDNNLDNIKRQAITELRPLVNKLDLSPDDKFDTLLLLIRTTDDSTLIAPAHDAAVKIADDARRAQALLDVIKEIDFFSRKK